VKNHTALFRYSWRLEANPTLREAMVVVDDSKVQKLLTEITRRSWTEVLESDIAGSSFDDVITQVEHAELTNDQRVYVLWERPKPQQGIVIPFSLFKEGWDDLWYPSSDDVVVVDEQISVIIRFSHEERLSIYQNLST